MEDTEDRGERKKRVKVKMEFVPRKEGVGNPYVAFFPSGFDPLKTDADGNPRAEICAYRNPKPLSRQQELVARCRENLDFVGTNYTGEAARWQPSDYLLGVFDKGTGSLKLLPLAGDKLFRMEPRVRGLEYGRDIDKVVPEEEEGTREMAQAKRRMLIEAFGSQRSRLKAARYDRAQVKKSDLGDFKDIEGLFQEVARKNPEVQAEQEDPTVQKENEGAVRNIPPHDLTATIPAKAYLLDKMIRPDEWETLAADVKELKSFALSTGSDQSYTKKSPYPAFVLERLKRLRIQGDMEGNQKRAHILVYMLHLLAFHFEQDSVIKKAADPLNISGASNTVDLTGSLGIPVPIVAKFLEIFTAKGVDSAKASRGCERSSQHKQLTIGYLLVLGLMVDEFQADPYDLARELKLTITQVRPHYEQLGCKFIQRKPSEMVDLAVVLKNSGKQKWRVTLPVPLAFPKIKARTRARGR